MNEKQMRGDIRAKAGEWAAEEQKNLKEWDGLVAEYEDHMQKAMAEYQALAEKAELPQRKKLEVIREFASMVEGRSEKALAEHNFDELRRLTDTLEGLVERARELSEDAPYRETSEAEKAASKNVAALEKELTAARGEREAAYRAAELAAHIFEEGQDQEAPAEVAEDPTIVLQTAGLIDDVDRRLDQAGVLERGYRLWFYRKAAVYINKKRGDQEVIAHVDHLIKKQAHLVGPVVTMPPSFTGR